MRVLWLALLLAALATASLAEAKRKRKFEGDFEFAEEEEGRSVLSNSAGKTADKKRWVHDPNSELCQPLKCKKKELCLLGDPYTAVCVNKKELHRDVVVPKSKLTGEEARRFASASHQQSRTQEQEEDDVFYDAEDEDDEDDSDSNQDVIAARCNPCPVVKPTFLCGTDNRTYSSLCRLDYHNCIHRTSVKVLCKGFCPCKDGDIHLRKKQKQADRMASLMNKYKATMMEEKKSKDNLADKYTFTPQDFNYDNKHYKYIKYTKHDIKPLKNNLIATNPPYYEDKERMRGDNEVIEKKTSMIGSISKSDCSPQALQAIGDRLLDWFSVIMADAKRRQTHTRPKAGFRFPTGCKTEVRWMFHHLDTDTDAKLSLQELYDLEHDQNERCIKPFLDACDSDRDIFVTPHEWCKCFDKTDRPCAAVKRRISTNVIGVYVPECDSEGYYYHTQCHNAVGMCWCVDKHGVETPNSRTRGKPNCEALLGKSKGKLADDVFDNDDDEDDDDSDQDIEGSADQPLDF